jgi:uncharacterized SAM-binding protein YcdF (DUF218 family)
MADSALFCIATTTAPVVTRFIYKMIVWFVLCLCVWLGGLSWYIRQIPSQAVSNTSPADAIVVLTGGSNRLEHGLQLLVDNKGKVLFISGVGKTATLGALLQNIPANLRDKAVLKPILLGYEAENTIGNAREISEWLSKEGHKTVHLVTSNYHMPRSLEEMHIAAPEVNFIPAPVFPQEFVLYEWWRNDFSRSMILSEYHKFIAGKFRHWFVIIMQHTQL